MFRLQKKTDEYIFQIIAQFSAPFALLVHKLERILWKYCLTRLELDPLVSCLDKPLQFSFLEFICCD